MSEAPPDQLNRPQSDLWEDHPSSEFDAIPPEPPPTPEPTEFNDAHLKQAMVRAMWIVVVLTSVLFSVLLLIWGWQTALLLVVGAAISLASLWEWRKLLVLIMARLDNRKTVGQGRVIFGFFLRLIVAAAVLYGSLRSLHGSVYALIGGLALAMVALAIEAGRLLRSQ